VTAAGDHLVLAALIPAIVPVGAGMGFFIPTLIGVVLRGVPSDEAGSASGMLTTAQQLGNALGVAIVGTVFFGALGDGVGGAAYGRAFAAAAAIQVIAGTVGAVLVMRSASAVRRAAALASR
jgi:hypothetical protein